MEGIDKAFAVHRLQRGRRPRGAAEEGRPRHLRHLHRRPHRREDRRRLHGPLPDLKIVGNFGVGYDSVDVAAAAKRGVVVTNTPDVLTEEVADTTLGLLLGTVREFYKAEKWLRDGRWAKDGDYRLTAGLAARPLGRHRRPRPHRQGHRAALRGLRLPVSYFGAQAAARRRPTATTPTWWPWRATSIR